MGRRKLRVCKLCLSAVVVLEKLDSCIQFDVIAQRKDKQLRWNIKQREILTSDMLIYSCITSESFYFSFYITICNMYKTVCSHIKFLNLDFNQRRPQSIYHQDQSMQLLHYISTIPEYSNFFLLPYHSPVYNLIVIH